MEQEYEYGLSVDDLESVFADIKAGKEGADARLYNAYSPLIGACAKKYHINEQQITDMYNEVFIYIYNGLLEGVVPAVNFTMCFENMLRAQCYEFKTKPKDEFDSQLLLRSYMQSLQLGEREQAQREQKRVVAEQSLLYVTQVLANLSHNPEFAEANGLNELKIDMIRDFYGLNARGEKLSVPQLAQKYNMQVSRTQAVLVSGLKKLRDMQEFAPIRAQLRH